MANDSRSAADVLFGDMPGATPVAHDDVVEDEDDDTGDEDDNGDDEHAEARATVPRRSDADVLFGDMTATAREAAAQQAEQTEAESRVVPTHYTLELPYGSVFDQSDLDALTETAKTKGWTNEEAHAALAEMHAQRKARVNRFHRDLVADTEVGGRQLPTSTRLARELVDRFLPPDDPDGVTFRAEVTKLGADHWRPLIKLLTRIAKAMPRST